MLMFNYRAGRVVSYFIDENDEYYANV